LSSPDKRNRLLPVLLKEAVYAYYKEIKVLPHERNYKNK